MKNEVILSNSAKKGLAKCPIHVVRKFYIWKGSIEYLGLREIRKLPGYHDEPLRGAREGYRSIRLSRGWRAFYFIKPGNQIEIIEVVEVSKHAY
jgi:proteic killer suppression protein